MSNVGGDSLDLCIHKTLHSLSNFKKLTSWRLPKTPTMYKWATHPPPTPLLPALTPSAGELKVSCTGGAASIFYALVARCPKWPPSFFGGLFKTPVASPWWSHQCPI